MCRSLVLGEHGFGGSLKVANFAAVDLANSVAFVHVEFKVLLALQAACGAHGASKYLDPTMRLKRQKRGMYLQFFTRKTFSAHFISHDYIVRINF